jgi:hypothetical protein
MTGWPKGLEWEVFIIVFSGDLLPGKETEFEESRDAIINSDYCYDVTPFLYVP